MLNLRFVDTLREVAERGSFSAAAQALNYTQPAVSRQIASLERDAGMPLVVRSRGGIYLTTGAASSCCGLSATRVDVRARVRGSSRRTSSTEACSRAASE